VELLVVPRGIIKFTLTGANPAEGSPYTGPIEIGQGETTIYCYAEDDGVSARRNFTIPPAGNQGIHIEPGKPARLRKRIGAESTPDTFKLLARARHVGARLSELSIEVGSGTKTASLRFGKDGVLSAEQIEKVIATLREALADEMAEVRLHVHGLEFANGHDLSEFVKEWGLSVGPNEVEQ
jgi:hypothetical protein